MELLYLWVGSYNNIFKQEFHFSTEFIIEFKQNIRKLDIIRSDTFKLNLFSAAFLNITAVIGKNGSGKSSLFSLIKSIFSDRLVHSNSYILVAKTSDNNLLVIDSYLRDNEKIIDKASLDDGTTLTIEKTSESIKESIDLIAHSNSFSVYEGDFYSPRFLDISFNKTLDEYSKKSNELLIKRYDYLLKENEKNTIKKEDFETTKRIYINNTLPRGFLYHYELLANVNFISEYRTKSWEFIPNQLSFSFNQHFYHNYKSYFEKIGLGNMLLNIEHLLFEKQNDTLDSKNSIAIFKERIVIHLFLYCTIHDQYYYPGNKDLHSFIKKLSVEGDYEKLPVLIKSFFDSPSTESGYDYLKKINDFVATLDSQFNEFEDFGADYNNSYYLPVTDEVCKSLKQVFDLWIDNDFIFSFSWVGLSAGESALLNIFSRLNSIAGFPSQPTVWLLIDEGDLYLHPEWQRTFFNDLHKYLPLFFKDKKIQLFLTSHSPFLISDLPKENIIFLDKIDGLCKVLPNNHFKETFGANIHELFANSFILKNGLIGEFAKMKISELISEINNLKPDIKSIASGDKSKIRKRIEIIGEPVIKNKLLNEYFKNTQVEEEIEYLNKRIKELEKKRKQNLKDDTDKKE